MSDPTTPGQHMVLLALSVNLRVYVSAELNARLEQGDTSAIEEMETHLQSAINTKALIKTAIGGCSLVKVASLAQVINPSTSTWQEEKQ